MSYEKHVERRADHIVIRYTGSMTADDLPKGRNVFQDIAALCQSSGCERVLLDARELSVDLGTFDFFQLGSKVAEVSDRRIRFAMLGTVEQTLDVLMEDVAANRGANARSFTDETEALAWLSRA
jgi:hypothetical protein